MRAAFEVPGVLDTLYFAPNLDVWSPLPPAETDVKVVAVSLSHNDLDAWSGRIDVASGLFGFAGTVTAIGSAVSHLAVGDRVCGVNNDLIQMGNFMRVKGAFALKLQCNDDAARMARPLAPSLGPVYAPNHVSHMPSVAWIDRTVLVLLASSCAGIAVVVLARSKGANVFASVDHRDQAVSLASKTGLVSFQIFDSGLSSAVKVTERGGFDIILCVKSTDLDSTHSTTRFLLPPMGKLINLSVTDCQQSSSANHVDMSSLSAWSASFTQVNPDSLIKSSKSFAQQLL